MKVIVIALGVFSPKHFSAGPSYIVGLGKALAARGCHLTILTSKAGETQFRSQGLKATFWLVDGAGHTGEPGLMRIPIMMITRMLRAGLLLRKKRFDNDTVIFASSNLLWEIFPLLLVKDKAAVRIATFHMGYPSPFRGYRGAFTGRKKFPGPRETLAYLQYRLSLPCIKHGGDVIFAHTNMSHLLLENGIPREKIIGMDVGVAWDIIKAAAPVEEKYEACWVGRYNPQKGCDDLLEIWEMVARAGGRARLAVMGNVAPRLRPVAERKHLEESIEFYGPVSEEDKFRVMKASTVFLFPSYYEAVPLAVIEAMACGLPVVAYDLPVYKSHFPGGLVKVPIGDKRAFARAVTNVLNDDEQRTKLVNEAASVAARYTWDNAAASFILAAERVKKRPGND
jgi:glycosyltransferase involved in cell wall biosynthesis